MNNKPCPFCGSTQVHTAFENGSELDKWGYAACTDCAAQIGSIRTQYDASENAVWRAEAVALWNERFTPHTQTGNPPPD